MELQPELPGPDLPWLQAFEAPAEHKLLHPISQRMDPPFIPNFLPISQIQLKPVGPS